LEPPPGVPPFFERPGPGHSLVVETNRPSWWSLLASRAPGERREGDAVAGGAAVGARRYPLARTHREPERAHAVEDHAARARVRSDEDAGRPVLRDSRGVAGKGRGHRAAERFGRGESAARFARRRAPFAAAVEDEHRSPRRIGGDHGPARAGGDHAGGAERGFARRARGLLERAFGQPRHDGGAVGIDGEPHERGGAGFFAHGFGGVGKGRATEWEGPRQNAVAAVGFDARSGGVAGGVQPSAGPERTVASTPDAMNAVPMTRRARADRGLIVSERLRGPAALCAVGHTPKPRRSLDRSLGMNSVQAAVGLLPGPDYRPPATADFAAAAAPRTRAISCAQASIPRQSRLSPRRPPRAWKKSRERNGH
jgi:hypothetical protein